MTLTPAEFIRRFLIHVLPRGFHRIRHYGLLANGKRVANIALARRLLAVPGPKEQDADERGADQDEPDGSVRLCPCCGGRMIVIEVFQAGQAPRHQPTTGGIDSS